MRVENLHVTLRFLGELEAAALSRVQAALEAAAATAPFRVAFGGLGGFPTARAPRVVWAGVVAGAAQLSELHDRLEASLARQGISPEGRPFHPHVTLGRVRNPRGEPALARLLETPAGLGGTAFGEAVVEAVHLMRSDLGPGGSRYGVVSAVSLRGARALDAC
jgi:2'-5' RNA ligase